MAIGRAYRFASVGTILFVVGHKQNGGIDVCWIDAVVLSVSTVILFSERELTFTFAICYRPSVCLSSVVCNVRAPYSGN